MNGHSGMPSHIRVVIVGAGFAGLTAAIECVRHGHTVILLEKFKEIQPLGDIISFQGNAGRIFVRWSGIEEKLEPINHHSEELVFHDYNGGHIYTQVWSEEPSFGKKFNGHRGEIHQIVYQYAKDIGIDIRTGQTISEYFETESEAGVVSNSERIVGDVVLAADGVRSTARTIVLGHEDKPLSSGYAIYRAWFPSDDLAKDPLTAHLVNAGDKHVAYLGPDVHFLAASINDGKNFSWVCTHKDEGDIEESWSTPGKVEDALQVLDGWVPIVHAIVRATPQDRLVDWKLVYRDPLPTWLSPKKRIALIGDAAHPFLPTSIQGASQSMEDGVTIAVCLELASKAAIPDALRAYEKIRYERVRKAQKMGETTRDKWHKADFSKIKENPEGVKLRREPWLLDHDAEAHAYAVYKDTVASFSG